MRGRLRTRRRVAIGAVVAFALVAAACTSIVPASVAIDGTQANGTSWFPSLSHDGRYVAFESRHWSRPVVDLHGEARHNPALASTSFANH
jgi:hypothetical protein